MKLSVIIPVYNEEEIAASAMREIAAFMSAEYPGGELIFSDDGSTDSTREISGKTAAEINADPALAVTAAVIGYPDNRGKGSAVREGMLASTGDAALFTDCDLAYGLEIIRSFTAVCPSEAPVAVGSRAIHPDGYAGYGFTRKLVSQVYHLVVRTASGYRGSDSQTGIKIFSREAAHKIFALCEINRFAFDLEALLIAEKLGFVIKEVPVTIVRHRPSHIKFVRDTLRMLRDIRVIRKRLRAM